jgi:hypothetical protein
MACSIALVRLLLLLLLPPPLLLSLLSPLLLAAKAMTVTQAMRVRQRSN